MTALYNEFDKDAAHVLRCLIADGLIAPGIVDDRSIKELQPDDLRGFTQVHLFAGAGLWSVAARLGGWPDDRPIWSASCPCQPFSAAGKGLGVDDPRHLWPDVDRLVHGARERGFGPAVLVGEQVAGAPGYHWFDGARSDLAVQGYRARVVDIPACSVDAPHIRQRLYWCALADSASAGRLPAAQPGTHRQAQGERSRHGEPERLYGADCGAAADAELPERWQDVDARRGDHAAEAQRQGQGATRFAERDEAAGGPAVACADALGVTQGDAECEGLEGQRRDGDGRGGRPGQARPAPSPDGRNGSAWAGADWLVCHDGKARRTERGLRLLVDGVAGRIPHWRLAGNSIVAPLAAEVIAALREAIDTQAEFFHA